jgi:hypothetical protein
MMDLRGRTPLRPGEESAVTAATDQQTQAMAAAALLERWADMVPMWDPSSGERWDSHANRRYEAEKALERRLRNLPGCVLSLDSAGSEVDLTLAGIRVPRQNCLANACRAWAAEIRRRAMQ